jgi:DNA-binding CsgD family transcriptional regulator
LKRVRIFSKPVEEEGKQEQKKSIDCSNFFVFCEKHTGIAQFRAGSLDGAECSLDRVAGLFAMQCMVRGYNPNDFIVLVPAKQEIVGDLVARASELLEEGRAVGGPESLSPRQKEILHSVICNRANKEIASSLNITVRTVKFHISNLLNKFGVENRAELARRAAGMMRPPALEPDPAGTESLHENPGTNAPEQPKLGPRPVSSNYRVEKARNIRFQGQVATA